jgi:hypothetical protein
LDRGRGRYLWCTCRNCVKLSNRSPQMKEKRRVELEFPV